jgi:hypothetical protein
MKKIKKKIKKKEVNGKMKWKVIGHKIQKRIKKEEEGEIKLGERGIVNVEKFGKKMDMIWEIIIKKKN